VAIAARREAGPDQYCWRITPFMVSCYTIVPRAREANYIFTAAVPIDDMMLFGMTVIWSPDKPVIARRWWKSTGTSALNRTKPTITSSIASCRRRRASPAFAVP
jgi:hypothetical protein